MKVKKKIPCLIAVPTTSGSGSETTITAVISKREANPLYPVPVLYTSKELESLCT